MIPDLFPFQVEARDWLIQQTRAEGAALLSLDTGLGKSATAISAARELGARDVLVVCPAIMTSVWREEVAKFWPDARVVQVRDVVTKGGGPRLDLPTFHVVGYEYLTINDEAKRIVAHVAPFDVLILDESTAVKNPLAQRTRLIFGPGCAGRGIASMTGATWLLSATPVLNHAGELFPALRSLVPHRIEQASYDSFTRKYCVFKQRTVRTRGGRTKTIETISGTNPATRADLARRIKGLWYKRTKKQVLPDLPPMTIVVRPIPVDKVDGEVLAKVRSEDADELRAAIERGELESVEIHLSRLRRLFSEAKVPATIEWVTAMLEDGVGKVGVWGVHVKPLARIADALKEHGVVKIDGSTSQRERDEARRRFQEDPSCRACVGQIVAGGVGITLTAASRVVFHEQLFVPSLNYQAASRHHRIGTRDGVLVECLCVEGSIDEAVQRVLAQKAGEIAALEQEAAK